MATFDVDAYLEQPSGFDVDAHLNQPERSLGGEALRKAEFAARGFTDSALETVGAVPDLVSSGMRAVGIPTPERGFYTDALKSGWNRVGETVSAPLNAMFPGVMEGEPTAADKAVYGAGRGAGDAASIMAPAAALSNVARSGSLTQQVAKTMASQPILQLAAGSTGGAVGQATENPWLGLAAALAVPVGVSAARRAVSPVPNQLSPKEQDTARIARQMGINLTAGQETGSRPLMALESQLAKMPFSAKPQQAIYDGQRAALNRSVLSKAGIDADSLTPELLDDAYRTIGQQMDDLALQTSVNIDLPFFQRVQGVADEYGRRLPTDIARKFQSYYDDIMGMAQAARQPGVTGISVQGREFQKVTSGLKKAARQSRNDPDLQAALNGLVEAMDDAMVRSAPPEVASGWRDANRLYRNLKIIDDAVSRGDAGSAVSGDIPIAGLKNAVRRSDPGGYARGRGEFADDVRVGQFIQDRIPNSGTPERQWLTGMLTGQTSGLGAFGMGADPFTAATVGAGSVGLPPLTQKLLANPAVRRYLTNQTAAAPIPLGSLTARLLAAREKDRQLNPSYP